MWDSLGIAPANSKTAAHEDLPPREWFDGRRTCCANGASTSNKQNIVYYNIM